MSEEPSEQSLDRPTVAAFTDSYHPTVNGVTSTIDCWRDHWGSPQMRIVYPASSHAPRTAEYPVPSVSFPFYEGMRAAVPSVPREAVSDADLVHAHTGYSLGLAALRAARRHDLPLVASYHTPVSEYAAHAVPGPTAGLLERGIEAYERRFYDRADVVVVPSEDTAAYVRDDLGVRTDVRVLSNGIDTSFFSPTQTIRFEDRAANYVWRENWDFRARYDLPNGPLLGYTGRHCEEKRLDLILDALEYIESDVTVVFGGDGPSRAALERRANRLNADVRFLGFLPREELPAFYTALDAFCFPSPVETEGLVAQESIACGTPVVGADAGALPETIESGRTGFLFPSGDPRELAARIDETLAATDELHEGCLAVRDSFNVDTTLDELASIYREVL